MTEEEKRLLLKDLCGRLPYGNSPKFTLGVFKWKDDEPVEREIDGTLYDRLYLQLCVYNTDNMSFKPYLRPLSSMTEEEEIYYNTVYTRLKFYEKEDWLNAHHFDYRGLIERGLALEAPVYMYKN